MRIWIFECNIDNTMDHLVIIAKDEDEARFLINDCGYYDLEDQYYDLIESKPLNKGLIKRIYY